MEKEQIIISLKQAHTELTNLVDRRSSKQKKFPITPEGWTTKEIIAHLAAWHWAYIDEINCILEKESTWQKYYESEGGEDNFNKKAVGKVKEKSFEEVYEGWEESFTAFINKVEMLSNEEWKHRSGDDVWKDGTPVTVESLFNYKYNNLSHESGHAKQIKDILHLL